MKFLLRNKITIILILFGGGVLSGPLISYRGFYAWSDKLFQEKTLSLVNDILKQSGRVMGLPKNSQCDYTESSGGKIEITCGTRVLNMQMNKHNSTLYRCTGLKVTGKGYFDIQSGYCARGRYDSNGNVIYYNKDGNIISTDVIPSIPLTAHQG